MKIIFLLLSVVLFAPKLQAQIFSNPITGINPNTANPYTTGQTVAPNITVSGIGRGSGITGNTANNRYNARSWPILFNSNSYFEFTITPNVGYYINFSNFVYTGQVSALGPALFSFRSSIDGFASDIGSPTGTGATISLSAPAYQNITTAITFRLYAYLSVISAATFSIDDFEFNGTVGPLVLLPLHNVIFTLKEGTMPNSAIVNWHTLQDANYSIFIVEHSANGHAGSFIPLDTIEANQRVSNFSHTASGLPVIHQHYFRLKAIANDGSYNYSEVKTIKLADKRIRNISLFPNPANSRVTLSWMAAKTNRNTHIIITNAIGKTMFSKTANAIRGTNKLALDISHLEKGIYFVKLDNDSEILLQKLIVE